MLLERLGHWSAASKLAVLNAYRERDALRGERISWSGDGRGTAAGIDDDGNLVVFTEYGERLTLDAGDVQLVRSELSGRRRR
jgi:biotin-(acetyl-CoA carboxylase) ligase